MTAVMLGATLSAITDSATLRLWMQSIRTGLAGAGMVQTADTGQVDNTTVAASGVNDFVYGYEIWRFNDTLQATAPLFIKLEYANTSPGSGSLVNCGPRLYITVGKGSNGAGTISNILLPRQLTGNVANANGGSNSTSPIDGFASTGPDKAMCALMPWSMSTSSGLQKAAPCFIVERSRDSAGDPTVDGLSVIWQQLDQTISTGAAPTSSNGPPMTAAIAYATAIRTTGRLPVLLPRKINAVDLGAGGSLALSAISPVFPHPMYAPGIVPWQPIGSLSWVDDPGGLFTARVSGADREYRSIPLGLPYGGWGVAYDPAGWNAFSNYVGAAVLWG